MSASSGVPDIGKKLQEITSYKTLNIFEYVKEVQAGRSIRDFSNAGLTSIDQFTSRHRVEHSMFN